MKFRDCCQFVGIACLVGVVAVCGCRKDKGPAPSETVKADENQQGTAQPAENPQVIAMLAKADLVDGTEDHVVHRCAGCRLGMDGDEKNALAVGDYQMHFCSAGCRDRYAQDVTAKTLALVIPEGD